MIILCFVIFIILAIVCAKQARKPRNYCDDSDILWGFAAMGCGLVALGLFIGGGVMLGNIVDSGYINERIAVIGNKNKEVESGIQTMVKNYLEHEGATYKAMTPEEAVAYATAYPELASNELVKEQIATYKNNRGEILKLEQKKIDCKVFRWWLYFGGE